MNEKKIDNDEFVQYLENKNNPYKELKCNRGDSNDLILKNYKKLRLKVSQNQSLSAREKEKELKRLDFAYKLLSTYELKKLYDEMSLSEEKHKKDLDDLKFRTLDLLCELVAVASDRIQVRLETLPSLSHIGIIQDSKMVISYIYKSSGVLGFFRGFQLSFIISAAGTLRAILTNAIDGLITKITGRPHTFYLVIHYGLVFLMHYPLLVLNKAIPLSPPEYSTFEIIKMAFFGKGSLESLYYGATYYLGVEMASRGIQLLLNQIGYSIGESYKKSRLNSNDGDGNLALKYLDLGFNNKFSRVILETLFLAPLSCMRSYVPYQYVSNLISVNSNRPPIVPTSPISIFLNNYSTHGISRFYNGSLFMFISNISRVLLYDFSMTQFGYFN